MSGVHAGCSCLINAAAPAMCGAAMLVPDSLTKSSATPFRLLMGGIVGQFFKSFGVTIACATLFSLLMSFSRLTNPSSIMFLLVLGSDMYYPAL